MTEKAMATLWAKKINEALTREPLFQSVFIPKYKWFPKLCKRLKLGKYEHKLKYNATPVGTVKINKMKEVSL